MKLRTTRAAAIATIAALGLFAVVPACGGGAGGVAAGQGLILLNFAQDSIDNAVLNSRLRFEFSGPLDATTVGNASIQIREGGAFGLTVPGTFFVSGATVTFEPVLASKCDHSDSGLKPDTEYRVQVIGSPEQFAIRNTAGQSLSATSTYQFHTRLDTDPTKYTDQIPAAPPTVLSTAPTHGDEAVAVAPGNRIEIELSENVDPCTVNDETVIVEMYESGDQGAMTPVPGTSPVRHSGFVKAGSTADQTPSDPFTWGADNTTSYSSAPRRILCAVELAQDFSSTRIVVTPLLGYHPDPGKNASLFPENALLVVQLTSAIADYGGLSMPPSVFAFTTENLAQQTSSFAIENKGETPYIDAQTTAAVDPDPRAPERVQAYMLFAGDGDNGSNLLQPTLPEDASQACTVDLQVNDGNADDFDPSNDVLLDTGGTPNTCVNSTDGSTAVIWEFNSFRIRNGRTVRIVGVNPAIILVQGDIVIENGGRLLVHGDGQNGAPQGRGENGEDRYTKSNHFAKGGVGVAGGGDGGDSNTVAQAMAGSFNYGQDGFVGFGSDDYDPTMNPAGTGHGGQGAGLAGSPSGQSTSSPWDGSPAAGGGAGHAIAGFPGDKKQGNTTKHQKPSRGDAGGVYGDDDSMLAKPEAGSGGGSSGAATLKPFSTSSSYGSTGGAGGSGGGFVDLTSSGNVEIFGAVLSVGGRGGNGDGFSAYGASAGGGGGSGGAIRILTPNSIILSVTSVLSTAGGQGGTGHNPYSNAANRNDGGDGGHGRIAMEDSDSTIAGLNGANVTPGEGDVGFYRGIFDANRFQGGGLEPVAITDLIPIGNYAGFDPTFLEPVQNYGSQTDFKAGVPVAGSPGPAATAVMVEVRGYQMNPDGTADLGSTTGWVTIGYFRDSGVETLPIWAPGHPADIPVPADNTGGAGGFTELNAISGGGHEFLQVRFSFYLPSSVGPFDPGAYMDDWLIRFTHDQ